MKMKTEQINDTAHIQIGYGAEYNGEVVALGSFAAAKVFVRENGLKSFFAYDKSNASNTVKIRALYMDRYRESDIEDRLVANAQQGGKSFLIQQYKEDNQDGNG